MEATDENELREPKIVDLVLGYNIKDKTKYVPQYSEYTELTGKMHYIMQ